MHVLTGLSSICSVAIVPLLRKLIDESFVSAQGGYSVDSSVNLCQKSIDDSACLICCSHVIVILLADF